MPRKPRDIYLNSRRNDFYAKFETHEPWDGYPHYCSVYGEITAPAMARRLARQLEKWAAWRESKQPSAQQGADQGDDDGQA